MPDDAGLMLDDDQEWPSFGPGSNSRAPDVSGAPEKIGGPSRTRTVDPLIKSDPQSISTEVHDDVWLEDLYTWD